MKYKRQWKCFNAFKEKGGTYRFDDIIPDEEYQFISPNNKKWFVAVPLPPNEPSSGEEDIYDSIYMEVVMLVEKDNIQCDFYSATAEKLKKQFIIKKRQP